MTFNFEALPSLTKKEKKVKVFDTVFFICFFLLFFILDFYNKELLLSIAPIYFLTLIIVSISLFIYERKLKPKTSNFSIELNDNGITVIDNDKEIFINKSEIYEIILYFGDIKDRMPGKMPMPVDGKDSEIKIIASNNTIEKRIFIPEDMFYHRFNLLGIMLKDMGISVKMKNFL